MSVYSGKCDVYDHFWMRNNTEEEVEEEIKRTDFYICKNGRDHKLDIHSLKELIPYYPFLVASGTWGTKGHNKIFLSSDSFVDMEEKQFLETDMDIIKKYHRKCKRKKQEFNKDEATKLIHWNENEPLKEYETEIINRVATEGQNATVEGLSMPFKDWSRTRLYETMISSGYSEEDAYRWCFKEWIGISGKNREKSRLVRND